MTEKQLSVKEAIEVARKNSKLRSNFEPAWFHVASWNDRRADGLHPTRNDVDRYGKPDRKKKGSAKPKKWLK